LQGFPDDYTLVQFRGKPAADGPRYKALGNSMAVPVVSWLGARIAAVNVLLPSARSAAQNTAEAAKTAANNAMAVPAAKPASTQMPAGLVEGN
jgi:hypothetical protein